jgi:hypothetical protein
MQLEISKRMAMQISARTGLKESTCLDLLVSGWSFEQKSEGKPDQWVSPLASLTLNTGKMPVVPASNVTQLRQGKHAS